MHILAQPLGSLITQIIVEYAFDEEESGGVRVGIWLVITHTLQSISQGGQRLRGQHQKLLGLVILLRMEEAHLIRGRLV